MKKRLELLTFELNLLKTSKSRMKLFKISQIFHKYKEKLIVYGEFFKHKDFSITKLPENEKTKEKEKPKRGVKQKLRKISKIDINRKQLHEPNLCQNKFLNFNGQISDQMNIYKLFQECISGQIKIVENVRI